MYTKIKKIEKEDLEFYLNSIANEVERYKKFINKINNLQQSNFEEFVDKIIDKYNSENYRNRWISRGIIPQEFLFSELYSVAENLGIFISFDDYYLIYEYRGYEFTRIHGQEIYYQIKKI